LAEKCSGLQRLKLAGGQIALADKVMGFTEKPGGTHRAVVDAVVDLWLHHLYHGSDERARRVIFAAIAAGIAHVLDLGFVKVGKLVLFLLRAEAQPVHQLQRVAQGIAALELVFDLPKNLTDFVFDGVRAGGALFEALQVGKQLAVHMVDQIIAGQRRVMIE